MYEITSCAWHHDASKSSDRPACEWTCTMKPKEKKILIWEGFRLTTFCSHNWHCLFRRGYRDLRCCGVPVSLIFFVLVAVNKFPILRCCGDLKLYGEQYFKKPRALGGRNSLRTLCGAVVFYLTVVTKTRNIKNIALRLELKTPVIIYIFKRLVKGCIDIEVIAPTTECITGCVFFYFILFFFYCGHCD